MRYLVTCLLLLLPAVCLRSARQVSSCEVARGEALSARGETASSLLVLNRVIENFPTHGARRSDSLLLLRALYQNAANYQQIGNRHQALSFFRQAITIAKATGERKRLASLYNNVFGIYYANHEYSQAEDLLQMSLSINLSLHDSVAIRNNYNNYGLVCYERAQYGRALSYMNRALAYTASSDRVGRSLILTNRAEVFCRQGLYAQAERELYRALLLQRGHTLEPRTIQTSLNMTLVKSRLGKRGEVVRMLPSVYAAIRQLPLPVQANSYEQLADVHFTLGDSLGALRDIIRYQAINDSLQRTSNDSQLQQLLVAYDADRLKQHNDNLRQTVNLYRMKVSHRTVMVYCVAAFLLILAVLVILLLRRMRIDKEKSRQINEQQKQLLYYEQQEHRRKQQELSLEIDHKNRQLTSYTIDMASVNEFHQRIAKALLDLREKTDNLPAETCEQLGELVRSLRHFNDKPLGDDFKVYFDEVHPGFLMRLSQRYPLSKTDLRLCAYLYLGMTTKEIAALTFKEVRSVESSRNRLRKKLGLPPESNLHTFLSQFSADEMGENGPDTHLP